MNKLSFIRGIVRPVLTMVGFIVASYLVIVRILSVDVYMPLITMMIVFWFGERGKKNNDDTNQDGK